MKQNIWTIVLTFISMLYCGQSYCQNTKKLFTEQGLTYVVDLINDIGQFYDGTINFIGDSVINNKSILYYETKSNNIEKIQIDGFKVFLQIDGQYSLTYDFGLEKGDTTSILEFNFTNQYKKVFYKVASKSIIQYLDGKDRIRLELQEVDKSYNKMVWIEGIGKESSGIFEYEHLSTSLKCVTSDSGSIYIDPGFTVEECMSRSCRPLIAQFTIAGKEDKIELQNNSNNASSFDWDLGDGSFSSDKNISHTYKEKGCYRIRLMIKNACGETESTEKYYDYCQDSLWVKNYNRIFNAISFISKQSGWAINKDSLFHTTDGGITWNSQALPVRNDSVKISMHSINMIDENLGVITLDVNDSSYPKILITFNGGIKWEGIYYGEIGCYDAVIDKAGQIMTTSTTAILRSEDFGNTWQEAIRPLRYWLNEDLKLYENGLVATVDFLFPTTSNLKSSISTSNDYGKTWSAYEFAIKYRIHCVEFINAKDGFAGGTNVLLKTSDGGKTWSEYLTFSDYRTIKEIKFQDKLNGIAISEKYILRTTDSGKNWKVEYCQNKSTILDVNLLNDGAYVSTLKGLHEYKPNPDFDCTTSVFELKSNEVMVYPNPTNGVLFFKIPASEKHIVSVYNSIGNKISEKIVQDNSYIDLNDYEAGCYFIKIRDEKNNVIAKKVIKF